VASMRERVLMISITELSEKEGPPSLCPPFEFANPLLVFGAQLGDMLCRCRVRIRV